MIVNKILLHLIASLVALSEYRIQLEVLDTNFEDNVPAFVITSCEKNKTKTF